MYWKLAWEKVDDANALAQPPVAGRYVIHRHSDEAGPHFDLRLEQQGCLVGWRIEGDTLDSDAWATEKMPHPLHWLEHDGDALREDAGTYAWLERSPREARLLLINGDTPRILRAKRVTGMPLRSLCAMHDALSDLSAAHDPVQLLRDGIEARRRAIARLCGLGRELDGDAFDAALCRRSVEPLTLEELHRQLRTYEARFDAKYPPLPVSRPEQLPEDDQPDRAEAALAILRANA